MRLSQGVKEITLILDDVMYGEFEKRTSRKLGRKKVTLEEVSTWLRVMIERRIFNPKKCMGPVGTHTFFCGGCELYRGMGELVFSRTTLEGEQEHLCLTCSKSGPRLD